MSGKFASLMALVVILVSISSAAFKVQRVEASGTIYIKADGSIDPPDAPISTADNVTYTLTDNIYDSIVIERDNIIVDGAGYTAQGKGSGIGIDLTERSNVTIKNMEIKAFFHGIYLWKSSNNSISRNNITANNMSGIRLFRFSHNNIISENNITSNINGIGLVDSSGNRVYGNSIIKNHLNIELYSSSGNFVYHNHFVNNATQVYTYNSDNVWDDGYPSGGNFWSNYTGIDSKSGSYQNETGSDGIGDTAYIIDANNTDNYPLMGMFSNFTVWVPPYPTGGFEDVCIISNSTVSNLDLFTWLSSPNEYLQPGQLFIDFSVTGDNNTAGFCRITLPRRILNATSYVVIVNWQPVNVTILPFSNSTHDYLYFTYNHSTQEVIVTVLEFPSTLILPLFMIATLLTVIVYRRKHPI